MAYNHRAVSAIISAIMNLSLPTKTLLEINTWKLSEFVYHKLVPVVSYKPFPLDELLLMTAAVVNFKPDLICDWGTHVGKSARIFYEISTHFEIDTKLYSIDLEDPHQHPEHPGNDRGLLIKKIKDVTQLTGDGVTKALEVYKEGTFDKPLFFLDGDHSLETVTRELNTIADSVQSPVILVHDTFRQRKDNGYNYGPFNAVVAFVSTHPEVEVIQTATGLPGMSLIYWP